MDWGFYFAVFFVWVAVVWVLRCRRYALLQNVCDSALTESDKTRRQTLVWFAHYLLTSLELNFEVKAAMSFRGLLATCVLDGILQFSYFSDAFKVRDSINLQRPGRNWRFSAQREEALR